jgi:hypothetical protein
MASKGEDGILIPHSGPPREEGFDFDLTKKMDHLLTSIAVPSA